MKNKKIISVISLLLLLIFMLVVACSPVQTSSVKDTSTVMTVESNISMSDDANNPPVNDSVQTVTFTFSEPLDPSTISGAVALYQIGSNGNPAEQQCVAKINPDNPKLLDINIKSVEKFAEGKEYKIIISNTLKSTTGLALEKDFTGYFTKVFVKLNDYHKMILNIPTGKFIKDPKIEDLIGSERIFSTLPTILSNKYKGALLPIELANGIASLSTYPSAHILKIFSDSKCL